MYCPKGRGLTLYGAPIFRGVVGGWASIWGLGPAGRWFLRAK